MNRRNSSSVSLEIETQNFRIHKSCTIHDLFESDLFTSLLFFPLHIHKNQNENVTRFKGVPGPFSNIK